LVSRRVSRCCEYSCACQPAACNTVCRSVFRPEACWMSDYRVSTSLSTSTGRTSTAVPTSLTVALRRSLGVSHPRAQGSGPVVVGVGHGGRSRLQSRVLQEDGAGDLVGDCLMIFSRPHWRLSTLPTSIWGTPWPERSSCRPAANPTEGRAHACRVRFRAILRPTISQLTMRRAPTSLHAGPRRTQMQMCELLRFHPPPRRAGYLVKG
jgi:hypothetical protein